jgi:hypothetical protein
MQIEFCGIFHLNALFCFGVILQISTKLNIDEVSQSVMSQLKKKYHLNVDV